ncbi:MAG: WGR domain-containing protein [Burkholderiaceae bacterium]
MPRADGPTVSRGIFYPGCIRWMAVFMLAFQANLRDASLAVKPHEFAHAPSSNMIIQLTSTDPKVDHRRFYTVTVCADLFGDWSVVREWGRMGRPGTLRTDRFPNHALAIERARSLVNNRIRSGFAPA